MLPATDKTNYGGTILINPGGPGGSGTLLALGDAAGMQRLVGPRFDILGFDPRGVGATVPVAQCYDSPQELDLFSVSEVQMLRTDDGSIPLAEARDAATAALCIQKLGGNGREDPGASADDWGAGRFMDSKSVATDMLNIVQKLGQEKLLYYGLSYGTLLGQYFAALYPDKIGRMILDGVSDGKKWQHGQILDAIVDADKVMGEFFTNCVKAGAARCGVWEHTAAAVERRVNNILSTLRKSPIGLPTSSTGPVVVTEAQVRNIIFNALYSPFDGFPQIAQGLRAIETRNLTVLSQFEWFSPSTGLPPWLQANEAERAIACGEFPRTFQPKSAEAAVKLGTSLSKWAGAFAFARSHIACAAWRIRAKAPYTGPVSSANFTVPVLAVSNRFDPVTALGAARNVTARFRPGMRLLVQDTVGHTAALSLGTCTAVAMGTYMNTGVLPPEGTVCPPDFLPLIDDGGSLINT